MQNITFLSLLFFLGAQQDVPGERATAVNSDAFDTIGVGLRARGGVRVLYTIEGAEGEHVGIGVSALGDVDGDGCSDFIVGSMKGAYTFGYGPGSARVHSGRSGQLLYTVHGTEDDHSRDAFGDRIAGLGDVNGDGIPDFAVGAWRYDNYRGYVAIHSGVDGAILCTISGSESALGDMPLIRPGRKPAPRVVASRFFGGEKLGYYITGVGDLDLDGHGDFALGPHVFSGRRVALLFSLQTPVLGPTCDFDGDGRPDLLISSLACSAHDYWTICSGKDGRSLRRMGRRDVLSRSALEPFVGDLDGDGCTDIVTVSPSESTSRDATFEVCVTSGRNGRELTSWRESFCFPGKVVEVAMIGDIDEDGVSDLLVSYRGRPRTSHLHEFSASTSSLSSLSDSHRERGARVRIRSSATGALLCELEAESWTFGRHVANVSDFDDHGHKKLLFADYENSLAAPCSGRAWVISL